MPPSRVALYASTALALAFAARGFVAGMPSFVHAALALAAYGALVLTGVFVLRLRMFVDAVLEGPPGASGVAFTFDDGPDPASTPRVLAALDAAGARATFFVVGRKVEAHPEIARAIADAGHDLGLHGWAHDRLFSLRGEAFVRADLERGARAIEAATGRRPSLFRPPIGHTNPIIARVAEELGLATVGWSVSARDGTRFARAERVSARVRRGLRHGAIVLLHDAAEVGGHAPVAPDVLPALLREAAARGLALVPVAPWVQGVRASADR